MSVWIARGGRRGEREERLLGEGLIGGGWEDLPDLSGASTKEELTTIYQQAYPEVGRQTVAAYVGQLWSLLRRMQEGELVVMPLKTMGTIAVGRISGPYQYRTDLGPHIRHVRPVSWIATDVPRNAFDQDLLYSFGAYLTFGQVKRDNAEARVLAAIERRDGPPAPPGAPGPEEPEAPDVEEIAREQVRQFISRRFAGHELARLVGALLEAQGFSVSVSEPGPDRGVDILAGSGALGLDRPRVVVQVKTGQADVGEVRALHGVMTRFNADQGLLVAWGGFRGTARSEARDSYFTLRLWDAEDLLDQLFDVYERLPDDVRSELPLQRVWTLVPAEPS